MTYKTHYLGGLLAGLLVTSNIEDTTTKGLVIGVSVVASLIPDLDIPNSKLGRRAGVVSRGLNKAFGHRGLFHSPILYIIVSYFLQGLLPWFLIQGFLAGVFSHLALDMFNSTGIPVFYPISSSKISVASIKTRSNGETVFAVILVGLIVLVGYKYHISETDNVIKMVFGTPKINGITAHKNLLDGISKIKGYVVSLLTSF